MYDIKKFDQLMGLEGFSEKMLINHFSLYEGYVANVNKLMEALKTKEPGTPEYAELKRRFGWEWNGMRLHEMYFENMIKGGIDLERDSELFKKIVKDFGSFENCFSDFKAMASMRGIGWAIMCYDKTENKLFNVWVNEHDGGYLAGCEPILVMDVFEHAYMTDYETKRVDYINAFIKAINGKILNSRFARIEV